MSCYSTNDESTFFNKRGKKVLHFRADFERNDSFNRCLMTNNKETEQRRRFSTRQSLWPRDWGKWLIIRLLMLSGGSMDRSASALKGLIKSLESFQDASLTAALKPAQMSVRIPLGHQHTHIILCLKLNLKKKMYFILSHHHITLRPQHQPLPPLLSPLLPNLSRVDGGKHGFTRCANTGQAVKEQHSKWQRPHGKHTYCTPTDTHTRCCKHLTDSHRWETVI